jgi:CMP/dCMP kinase
MKKNVIAIDGPAASGKSTVANLVAERLGAYYINTGNMYRAITLVAIADGVNLTNPSEDIFTQLSCRYSIAYEKGSDGKLILTINSKPANLKKIRSPEVSEKVSVPSQSLVVRKWLVAEQRKMTKFGTIVMEGRDIGTNVFPDAKYKFYLTASPEVRAKRRLGQAGEVTESATVASVAKEIALRDELDSKREVAPLKKAEDAILVDSSSMTIDEVVNYIIQACTKK